MAKAWPGLALPIQSGTGAEACADAFDDGSGDAAGKDSGLDKTQQMLEMARLGTTNTEGALCACVFVQYKTLLHGDVK